jgi:hypothetical protein
VGERKRARLNVIDAVDVEIAVPAGAVATEEVGRVVGAGKVLLFSSRDQERGSRQTGRFEDYLPSIEEDRNERDWSLRRARLYLSPLPGTGSFPGNLQKR